MSYHIVSIDEPECHLTSSKGQLMLTSKGGASKTIPMEDVAALVITSFKCSLSNSLLLEAVKHRVGIVICEMYKPAAIVLPTNRATDTAIIRNLADLTSQSKSRLWGKTLTAKCLNQYAIAYEWIPQHPNLTAMLRLANSIKETREAEVAKLYWAVFADAHCGGNFTRDRENSDANALLNYAYAILLSLVLRNLLAFGLDPIFGIFHSSRAHSTPLAYDLMEPFRPIFDKQVAAWIQQEGQCTGITKEFRSYIGRTLDCLVTYGGAMMTLKATIEKVIRSFRKAVELNQVGPYEPWKISTTKWDG